MNYQLECVRSYLYREMCSSPPVRQTFNAMTELTYRASIGGDGYLYCIGSQIDTEPVVFKFPKLEANFVGSGDLFAALILGWYHLGMKTALKNTLKTMISILNRTIKAAGKERNPKTLELQIIRGKQEIETPPETHELTQVSPSVMT